MISSPCEVLKARLGELFTCSPMDGYTRIRTPFLYPDGDVIDVFFRGGEDVATVSDLGETLRWLKMQSLSPRRSQRNRS